jgi:putative transposase/transposase-like zinc-binding protein
MRPVLEVADIFRRHGPAYRQAHASHLGGTERRVMAAIEACRTPALGGHAERCADCGFSRHAYNSCRNRHCPKCQGLARAEWLAARQAELLPVPYFHVVFTVPAPVADLAFHNKAAVYGMLFHAAAEALRDVAGDRRYLGAEIGAVAVLHTWGQALHHHPHLHCIVPGGGLSPDQTRWVACPPGFLLPVRVLSRRFRDVFVRELRAAFAAEALHLPGALASLADRTASCAWLAELARAEWVVYAKPPFAGPEQVLGYLGRYTHRVALANSRLVGLEDGRVSFSWKDYRQGGTTKVMTLAADEFIRRFLQHTVPDGFHRIRHIGFLANRHRARKLDRCRALLVVPPPAPRRPRRWQDRLRELTGRDIDACPCCGGPMVTCGTIPPQPPPRPTMWCDSS